MADNFIAIDVETANRSPASICQIGLAAYAGAHRCWEWSTLVNPEEEFDRQNVEIHGIGSMHVQSAPMFPAVIEAISDSLASQIMLRTQHSIATR